MGSAVLGVHKPEPAKHEDPEQARAGWIGLLFRWLFESNLWILLILAVIAGFFGLLNPRAFLSVFNMRNVALDTAETLLLVLGETFVLITAGVDLSVGSMLVFSAVVAAKTMLALSGPTSEILLGH